MLDFVKHYYEVTEENINQLKRLMKDENIRFYDGISINIDEFVRIGRVLGNNQDDNSKCTGFWSSRHTMRESSLKKVTTTVQPAVMIME